MSRKCIVAAKFQQDRFAVSEKDNEVKLRKEAFPQTRKKACVFKAYILNNNVVHPLEQQGFFSPFSPECTKR